MSRAGSGGPALRAIAAAGTALVVLAVAASFVWQMLNGFCPVP